MKLTTNMLLTTLVLVAAQPSSASIIESPLGARVLLVSQSQQIHSYFHSPFHLSLGAESAIATADLEATYGSDSLFLSQAIGAGVSAGAQIFYDALITLSTASVVTFSGIANLFGEYPPGTNPPFAEIALNLPSNGGNSTLLLDIPIRYPSDFTTFNESVTLNPGEYVLSTRLLSAAGNRSSADLNLTVTIVPEPSTALLCLFGCLVALGRSRNNR